jgi:hypothetical protein
MSINNEVTKHYQHRSSGSGGSVWITTKKFINADLFVKAEGGGSEILRTHKFDDMKELVKTGGGGGNIQISVCGKSTVGFPKTSSAGGRTDENKENLNQDFSDYAGNLTSASFTETKWGDGGLVSFKYGISECPDEAERFILTKELPLYAITYKTISSTGSLSQITKSLSNLQANPSAVSIPPAVGCYDGISLNTYLEFHITDNELEGSTLISSELILPAVGQSRWNDKFTSDSSDTIRMDRSQIGDTIKIRPTKTLNSLYSGSPIAPIVSNLVDSAILSLDPTTGYFLLEKILWINNIFFDADFGASFSQLQWPKNASIKEPGMLELIEKIQPTETIFSAKQAGASLGFVLERPAYFVQDGITNRFISCEAIVQNSDSSTSAQVVYFNLTSTNFPKLKIMYHK